MPLVAEQKGEKKQTNRHNKVSEIKSHQLDVWGRPSVRPTGVSAPTWTTNLLCGVVSVLISSRCLLPPTVLLLPSPPILRLHMFHSAQSSQPEAGWERHFAGINQESHIYVCFPEWRPRCQPASPHATTESLLFSLYHNPGKTRNTVPQPRCFSNGFMSLHRWTSWTPVLFVCRLFPIHVSFNYAYSHAP